MIKSFLPISTVETQILVLGTMPGKKSLEMNEYYANSRNSFWKIISTITSNELPMSYADKKSLLIKTRIGIWDVIHKANRIGSLDQAIKDEQPNDLPNFIITHKNIRVIAFNGQKAEKLFDKYFDRNKEIKYIPLPSTSPAHASMNFEKKCEMWREIYNIK